MKVEQKQFSGSLDSLEGIDVIIQKEVEAAIEEAEKRAKRLSKEMAN